MWYFSNQSIDTYLPENQGNFSPDGRPELLHESDIYIFNANDKCYSDNDGNMGGIRNRVKDLENIGRPRNWLPPDSEKEKKLKIENVFSDKLIRDFSYL